jgi:hypothetical protein
MPRRAGERPNPSHIWTGWWNLVHAADGSAGADFIIARRSCKNVRCRFFYRAFPEAGRLLTRSTGLAEMRNAVPARYPIWRAQNHEKTVNTPEPTS